MNQTVKKNKKSKIVFNKRGALLTNIFLAFCLRCFHFHNEEIQDIYLILGLQNSTKYFLNRAYQHQVAD